MHVVVNTTVRTHVREVLDLEPEAVKRLETHLQTVFEVTVASSLFVRDQHHNQHILNNFQTPNSSKSFEILRVWLLEDRKYTCIVFNGQKNRETVHKLCFNVDPGQTS